MKCLSALAVSISLLGMLTFPLASTALAEKERITVWAWGEAALGVQATIKLFEERTGIEVNLVKMGPWDVMDKFLISLRAGKGAPDVCRISSRVFDSYAATGKLVDLTDVISPHRNDLLETALKATTFKNRNWAAPGDINPGWVLYNWEIFARYGIDPNKIVTWAEMIAAGRKLSGYNIKLLHLSVPSHSLGVNHFVLFLNSRAGNIYDANGQVIRNNKLAKDTLRWYYDLKDVAFLAPNEDPSAFAALKEGKVATFVNNASTASVVKKLAPELAGKVSLMPWPKWSPDAKPTTGQWGGGVWTIPKQSTHKEAAIKFINFLTATEAGALAYYTESLLLPAYKPVYKAKAFRQPDPYFSGQVTYEALEAREVPALYQVDWSETEMVLQNAIDPMFQGSISPEVAWDQIERQLIDNLGR